MSFHPTTRRLILRAPMLSDMAAFVAILGDYDVAKNLEKVPHPYTPTMYREALACIDRERCDRTAFYFAVNRAMDGALIGMCAVEQGADGAWELGYWYGRSHWGQGYATEAARPVLRLAFEDMGAERLTAGWFADNSASGAVLEKLGFAVTATEQAPCAARGGKVPSHRAELTREQFARKKAA